MSFSITNFHRGLLLAIAFLGGASQASAADIRVGISSRETYVGVPIVLQIQIRNASRVDPPEIPAVDGLDIRAGGTPSRSTQIATINGRTTRTTSLTYAFEITPTQAGRFRIPPITIQVDGTSQQTGEIDFVASKSETGDLIFVEVAGKEKQIYVGQALDLTLRIWLGPFRDTERNIKLSPDTMWQLVSPQSHWGVFHEQIAQLANNGQQPRFQEVLRKDRDGVVHSYYLYEIDATIYPNHAGEIDADKVRVVVQYPTALAMTGSFDSIFDDMSMPGNLRSMFGDDDIPSLFGRRLTIQSARPIVADASVEPMDVLPIPTEGRPDDYAGAVGRYQMVTEATPTTVKAGDPIELFIGVMGTGPMELVQAPPLAKLPELTAGFRVPGEPLAGFVQNDRKVFSTTIRPRNEGVTEIPAIPFTFFDPQQGQFVTVHSKPISIHVDPAETLALDAIVAGRSGKTSRAANGDPSSTARTAPFQNDSDVEILNNDHPRHMSPATLSFFIVLPPLFVIGIGVARNRNRVWNVFDRFRMGSLQAHERIQGARNVDDVCDALQAYAARRLSLHDNAHDPSAVIGALRASGQHKLAIQCERVLHAPRHIGPSGVGQPASLTALQQDALAVVTQLKQLHQRGKARPQRRQSTTHLDRRDAALSDQRRSRSFGLVIFAATMLWTSGIVSAAPQTASPDRQTITPITATSARRVPPAPVLMLTTLQRQEVLEQASETYAKAMNLSNNDSADAKQAFTDSAAKYQLLVDSGVTNSRLYVNLANAYLQAGQRGKAIANYCRAIHIDPSNQQAKANLARARQLADSSNPDGGDLTARGVASRTATVGKWLSQKTNPFWIGSAAVAAWIALWFVIGLRLLGLNFPWKSSAAAATMVVVVSLSLSALRDDSSDSPMAVIASPSAQLREGDGADFPMVGSSLREGESVVVVKRRGDWFKVRSESGQTGWIGFDALEIL